MLIIYNNLKLQKIKNQSFIQMEKALKINNTAKS